MSEVATEDGKVVTVKAIFQRSSWTWQVVLQWHETIVTKALVVTLIDQSPKTLSHNCHIMVILFLYKPDVVVVPDFR